MAKGTTKVKTKTKVTAKVAAATAVKKYDWLDGKAAPDPQTNIRTIDDIIGVSKANPFRVGSIEEFERKIDSEMNLADMQALASRVGLLPISDRPLLKKRLLEEYKRDFRKRTPYNLNPIQVNEGLNHKLDARAKKILGEGK